MLKAAVEAANKPRCLHFYNQDINKQFHGSMRRLRDDICKQGVCDTIKVNFNNACAFYAKENISKRHVTNSVKKSLFPFQHNLADRFKTAENTTTEEAALIQKWEKSCHWTSASIQSENKTEWWHAKWMFSETVERSEETCWDIDRLFYKLKHEDTVWSNVEALISVFSESLHSVVSSDREKESFMMLISGQNGWRPIFA